MEARPLEGAFLSKNAPSAILFSEKNFIEWKNPLFAYTVRKFARFFFWKAS